MRAARTNVIRIFRHLMVTGPHRRRPNRRACITGKWNRGRCSLRWSATARKRSQQTTTGVSRATLSPQSCTALRTLHALPATTSPKDNSMEIRVAYEHSLATAPEEFIVQVPSQLVTDIPANVPRALLPEFIANLIVERSPAIGKIRNLRIL